MARKIRYEKEVDILKALAHSSRLAILEILEKAPQKPNKPGGVTGVPVSGLAKKLGISMTSVSKHLKELKTRKLIESERDGNQIYYRLTSPQISSLVQSIKSLVKEIR